MEIRIKCYTVEEVEIATRAMQLIFQKRQENYDPEWDKYDGEVIAEPEPTRAAAPEPEAGKAPEAVAPDETPTLDDLRDIVGELLQKKGAPVAHKVLADFGVARASELPDDQRAEFVARCREEIG